MIVLEAIGIALLLFAGIWLSAFFSGAETAFYRLSPLRVQVEAESGNARARRVLQFVRKPSDFVATVLIGNNVANYITTLAIGLMLAVIVETPSMTAEVALTFAVAPVVFLFGELVPKNVNYLTPLRSILRKSRLFAFVYAIARPLSLPLVALTRWLESVFASEDRSTIALLSRPRIRDLIVEGHLQGVMSDGQVELTNRLLRQGMSSIATNVRPLEFVFALPATSSRETILDHANQFGLTHVPLHAQGEPGWWVGAVRVADLYVDVAAPSEVVRDLPRLDLSTSHLAAIQSIREAGTGYGLVISDGQPTGFVSGQSLTRPLFLDAPAIASPDA